MSYTVHIISVLCASIMNTKFYRHGVRIVVEGTILKNTLYVDYDKIKFHWIMVNVMVEINM